MVSSALIRATWAAFAAALIGFPASAGCTNLDPAREVKGITGRGVEALDLASLRDIGPNSDIGPADPLLTPSPDGKRVAFQLRQADPASNTYCLAMVEVGLDGSGVRVLDAGGDMIRIQIDLRGNRTETGIARPITARWSSDGRWIAFLKKVDGRVAIWRADADGSGSRPLVTLGIDVIDFRFAPDGGKIIIKSAGLPLESALRAGEEDRSGYRYDDRFVPGVATKPGMRAGTDYSAFDPRTGSITEATEREASWLQEEIDEVSTGEFARRLPDGTEARLSRPADEPLGTWGVSTKEASTERRCAAKACTGRITGLWSTPEGRVRFLRREGWGGGDEAIYEWAPGSPFARRLHLASDRLSDCFSPDERIICLEDGPTNPRRLVSIDPSDQMRILYDPNPEFGRLRKGAVERLRLRNRFGTETYGDLVLPVGYMRGRRYPLVVVQYESRGFLRGGTGDEYPIQVFANHGYAVLSVQRPVDVGIAHGARTYDAIDKINLGGFADRRSVHSSLMRLIRKTVDIGVADPARIGITGLSDGATSVQWALIHEHIFKAAAVSTCCTDPTLDFINGPAGTRHFLAEGYPPMNDRKSFFWRQTALSYNATRLRTPLLMQLADDEYLSALSTYEALREARIPEALFVFEDEHHVKWQPAHRLAIYQRNVEWFDRWLKPDDQSASSAKKSLPPDIGPLGLVGPPHAGATEKAGGGP